MAHDFKKAFEDLDQLNYSPEKAPSDLSKKENLEIAKESAIESAPEKGVSDFDFAGEGKKRLEKSGEALKKAHKKTDVTLSDSDKELVKKIDNILSEGLEDVFLSMNPARQKLFKSEGEKTVLKIKEAVSGVKVRVKKIIKLIKDWLKIIPGVNRYFLEQEAKIKADKIIKLKNKK